MNPNTHIYLYAKGWYKRNDIIEDLKIICSERCGQYNIKYIDINNPVEVEECKVSLNDVIIVLTNIVYPHLKNAGEYLFTEFISNIAPENTWKIGYITNQSKHMFRMNEETVDYNYRRALLHEYLSILHSLSIAHIKQIDGEDIGEVNYELFPMLKKDDENLTS